MSLEIKNLTKIYGTQKAVNGVSFSVKKGEIVGFLGPNGAGKSTTMKIACCFLNATFGEVQVAGYSVSESPDEVRKRVGYLPEHNPLYLDMYVKEALSFTGQIYGLSGKRLRQKVADMIELTGLTREQHKKTGALSKGYRQRVGLAQALIHDPEVLILDEPTTGLDPNQILEIRELITNAGKDKTVIFSTHILQEVQAVCQRAIIINQGELVADGSVDSLLSDEGRQTIIVQFDREVDVEEIKRLPQITGVQRGQKAGQFSITTSQIDETKAAVFRLAADRQWLLQELRQEEVSLQEVFRQLTNKQQEHHTK